MIRRKFACQLCWLAVTWGWASVSLFGAEGLPFASPESVGMDATRLASIQPLVGEGIAQDKMPGCVVCVGRHGKIVFLEAFGERQTGPASESMTTDTVFDMASITKPVATATSIMKLIENGRLRLGDQVTKFLPDFAPHGKDDITIQHLLVHQSGLIPDNKLADYEEGPEIAWQRICDLELVAPVGKTFKYSDVNFIVLAKLVEVISGRDVNQFSHEEIFGPLGMDETGYLPREELQRRAAPTEKRDGDWMRGEVHDPRAYELGGVAGHAGLFSTAEDLAIYAQMMLSDGSYQPAGMDSERVRILSPRTVAKMTAAYPVSSGFRGLGWDKQTGYSSNRGDLLSESAFGHGGFTGTVLWIDPELDLFFIFLSNRVHPNGKGSVNHLAGQIVNLVASSVVQPGLSDANARVSSEVPGRSLRRVLSGLDILKRNNYSELRGQRVGLITNHTGLDAEGNSAVKMLHESEKVNLRALFSPEHGFAGQLDVSRIDNAIDPTSGLTIFSLYGETRKPTPEMLAEVDTLVFDIQDIGCRFYTYISTMGEAMRAAADAGKRLVVLDRPNPIGGLAVAGPMLDAGKESFVGYHILPVRHGMTVGEIALMLNAELNLGLDLKIVQCEGWRRADTWDQTGLTWVNPSPNMRSLTQAFLYPGIGLLETTNVSVGRGTDTPFEVLGAPWIDGRQLARRLNARQLPGAAFIPIRFRPDASKFADQDCSGINIVITNREAFEPVRVGLEIASQLRALYPDDWDTTSFNRLLCNDAVYETVVAGKSLKRALHFAQSGIPEYMKRRALYLLYE